MSAKQLRRTLTEASSERVISDDESEGEESRPTNSRREPEPELDLEALASLSPEALAELSDEQFAALDRLREKVSRSQTARQVKHQRTRNRRGRGRGRTKKGRKRGVGVRKTPSSRKKPDDDDFLDQIVTEQSSLPVSSHASSQERAVRTTLRKELLDPMREFRRLLDETIPKVDGDAKRKHRQVGATWLTAPKSSWPQYHNPGISMHCLSELGGVRQYAFVFTPGYEEGSRRFEMSLMQGGALGPDAFLAAGSPWHVGAQLALSEVYRMRGEGGQANDSLDRALYVFERSWMRAFWEDLLRGKARMAVDAVVRSQRVNLPFFLSLWHRVHATGIQGACGTAFELTRLIWSLDPVTDPCHVALLIDYFALRAGQPGRFVAWVEEDKDQLLNLPSVAYSYALALFLVSRKTSRRRQRVDEGILAAAEERAFEALDYAAHRYPCMICPLLDALEVNVVEWNDVLRGTFARGAVVVSSLYDTLIHCYVERMSEVYQTEESLHWFLTSVKRVLVESFGRPNVASFRDSALRNYQGVTVSEVMGKVPPPALRGGGPVDEPSVVPPGGQQDSDEDGSLLLHFFRSLFFRD